jgi:hypothetical protein
LHWKKTGAEKALAQDENNQNDSSMVFSFFHSFNYCARASANPVFFPLRIFLLKTIKLALK